MTGRHALCQLALQPKGAELKVAVVHGGTCPAHDVHHIIRLVRRMPVRVQYAILVPVRALPVACRRRRPRRRRPAASPGVRVRTHSLHTHASFCWLSLSSVRRRHGGTQRGWLQAKNSFRQQGDSLVPFGSSPFSDSSRVLRRRMLHTPHGRGRKASPLRGRAGVAPLGSREGKRCRMEPLRRRLMVLPRDVTTRHRSPSGCATQYLPFAFSRRQRGLRSDSACAGSVGAVGRR